MDIGKAKYSFQWKENVLWPINDTDNECHFNILNDKEPVSNLPTVLKKDSCCGSVNDYVFASNLFCKHLIVGNMAPVEDKVECGIDYFLKENDDDTKLAQLISKFDRSIEAIWNLSNTHTTMYDVMSGQEDLRWTFQASISSQKELLKMELNQHPNEFAPEKNGFIHCGMNITNSIWSKQPYSDHYGKINHTQLKPAHENMETFDNFVNEDYADMLYKLKFLMATDGIIQDKVKIFEWNSVILGKNPKKENSNLIEDVCDENADMLWNKIKSFPNVFSDLTFQPKFCPFRVHNCAEEHVCMLQNYSPTNTVPFDSNNKVNNSDPIILAETNWSFNALNHNPEDSSFTLVNPRQHSKKVNDNTIISSLINSHQIKYHEKTLPVDDTSEYNAGESGGEGKKSDNRDDCSNCGEAEASAAEESIECNEENDKNGENNDNDVDGAGAEKEEDLLTSMRTHFRPIQQEHNNNPNYCYVDGTTFIISSSFVDVAFRRSASGTLYLDTDDPETTQKYMEYRDVKLDKERCSHNFSENVSMSKNVFIPKFCVNQIEKCCQTEGEFECDLDSNTTKINSYSGTKSNLLLTEDNSLIKEMVNSLDEDSGQLNVNNCCGNNNDTLMWMENLESECSKRNDTVCQTSQTKMNFWNERYMFNNNYLLSSKHNMLEPFGHDKQENEVAWNSTLSTNCLCQSRFSIWCCSPEPSLEFCPACDNSNYRTPQYCQLRDELSKDGEQLLSDLRYLQHLQLDSGCMEDVLEPSDWPAEPNLLAHVGHFENCTSLCKKCM